MIGAPPAHASAHRRLYRTPAAPASTSTWLLRVNPLARRRLADARQSAWLARLTSLDQALDARAPRCSDELYEQIGMAAAAGRTEEKKALLAVRRAIHNGRIPAAVPGQIGPAAARWIELARTRAAVLATIEGGFEAALARERTRLAECLGDPDFARSLALVADEVHAAAIRYRAGVQDGAPLPQCLRKSERGLLQYLTRAMVRTSPLSRFTAVGLARLDPAGIPLDQVQFTGATPFVGVDLVMFNYVAGGLVGWPEEADGDACIQLSPQVRLEPDNSKVIFTRAADGKVRVRALPVTDQIMMVLELTSMGPRRLTSVARDLAGRLGEPEESAADVLRTLLDAGMLCVAPGPEEIVASPIRELSGRVAPEQSALLLGLVSRLDQFGAAAADERADALTDIGALTTKLSRAADRPAFMQVDEDYVLRPVTVSTNGYAAALGDLADTVSALAVFDPLHDFRALLSAAFVERFGAGATVPLTSNAKALTTTVYQRYTLLSQNSADDLGPRDGSLARLHAVRRGLREMAAAALAAGADEREIVIPAADLAASVAALPERFRAAPLSYGVFVQPWHGSLIFNDALAGHGILFGRFLGADRELGGWARQRLAQRMLARYGTDGVRVAEDRGLHRLNVNARPPTLDDRLSPDDWFSLGLQHDPDSDQLWVLDPDGRRVRVLTFGTGHPELYPPPLRVANWLVSCSRLQVPFVDDFYRAAEADTSRTMSCPRLRAGSVIISRRRWYGHDEFDQAVNAKDEVERLAALARWRAVNEVPEEVVFKTPSGPPGPPRSPGATRAKPARRDKPQYVDLSSGLFTRVMPRLLERRQDGYVEEALPVMADSPHAFEWVVEVSRPAFGEFVIEEA